MAEQKMPIIQLYTNDEAQTAISPLLDYQQMTPIRNFDSSKFQTENAKYYTSYGIGKYVITGNTSDTSNVKIREFDINNMKEFNRQLIVNDGSCYPLLVSSDKNGYMYSVIPNGTFATEQYVKDSISNAAINGTDIDLSNYATKDYVDDKISNIILPDNPDENIEALTIFAYINSENKPDAPIGGSWIKNDNGSIIINYPDNWHSLDMAIGDVIWMSSSIQMENGKFISNWTEPILFTVINSQSGTGIKFIYHLTENDLTEPSNPNGDNGYGKENSKWTDTPQGIDNDYQCEWISTAQIKDDIIIGQWSRPAIWSKWGIDGKNGNEIEYIYYRNNGEVVNNPTIEDFISSEEYQTSGWKPENWTNNPQGINNDYSHEWVSIRKKIDNVWREFSDPVSWAIRGKNGDSGYSIRTLYKIVKNNISGEELKSQVDIFRTNNDLSLASSNGWNITIPNIAEDEWLWSISAYINAEDKFIEIIDSSGNSTYGWQGPILVTGKGKDATPINYNSYVYANSIEKPNIPSINNINDINENLPIDGIWYDYPNTNNINDIDNWWQCIGIVNGVTGNITWGKVIPLNGRDGIAKDGKYYETRLALVNIDDNNEYIYEINKLERNPNDNREINEPNWILANKFNYSGILQNNQCILQTVALIDYSESDEGKLIGEWSEPYRISGENGKDGSQGPEGKPGPDGLTGTPGTNFVIKYCRGKIEDKNGDGIIGVEDNVLEVEDEYNYDSSGWYDDVNYIFENVSEEWPYIYCVQGREIYTYNENTGEFDSEIKWGTPFRLSGTNGLNGLNGSSGKIIYPAGLYNVNTEYTSDDNKTPYVYFNDVDNGNGGYFILKIDRWLGTEQDNKNPVTSIASGQTAWEKFESYDAIYGDIGMFKSALVGQAVFNGDYMFSQNGIDENGIESNHYENFRKDDNDNLMDSPYDEKCIWKPAYCVNFKTGQQWTACGKVIFNSDGSGELAGGQIWWDTLGNLTLPLVGQVNGKYYLKDERNIDKFEYAGFIGNGVPDSSINLKFSFYSDDLGKNKINDILYDDFIIPGSFEYNTLDSDILSNVKIIKLFNNDKLISQCKVNRPQFRESKIYIDNNTNLIFNTNFDVNLSGGLAVTTTNGKNDTLLSGSTLCKCNIINQTKYDEIVKIWESQSNVKTYEDIIKHIDKYSSVNFEYELDLNSYNMQIACRPNDNYFIYRLQTINETGYEIQIEPEDGVIYRLLPNESFVYNKICENNIITTFGYSVTVDDNTFNDLIRVNVTCTENYNNNDIIEPSIKDDMDEGTITPENKSFYLNIMHNKSQYDIDTYKTIEIKLTPGV